MGCVTMAVVFARKILQGEIAKIRLVWEIAAEMEFARMGAVYVKLAIREKNAMKDGFCMEK